MQNKRSFLPAIIAALSLLLAASACAPRKQVKKTSADDLADVSKSTAPYNPAAMDVTEASLRGMGFLETPELDVIYFDYDSSDLKEGALDTLKKNAQYLKAHKDVDVLVAGHCDERGTIEYNLALAQKRAKEVREYYARLGVSAKTIATISYGKEKPLCSESTEECWSKNRRAETRVRKKA